MSRRDRRYGRKKRGGGMGVALLFLLLVLLVGGTVILWVKKPLVVAFNIPQKEKVQIPYGEAYEAPAVEAEIRLPGALDRLVNRGIPVPVTMEGEVDPNTVGTYTETYRFDLLELGVIAGEAVREITVTDLTAPVILLQGSGDVVMEQQEEEYVDPGCTAEDNVDGDLTRAVSVGGHVDVKRGGVYTLTYRVKDAAGNEAVSERRVTVLDTEKPSMMLKGKESMSIALGGTFNDPGCDVMDNTDGVMEALVQGEVNTEEAGKYVLTYSAVDAAGNEATVTRTVYVKVGGENTVVDPGSKVVYLSFDDGPGQYTQQLLDILDKYDAKVTFFVTHQFPAYENMIAKEAAAGHTVAVHTYSHDFSKLYSGVEGYFDDFDRMSDVIEKQTGKKPTILRFPGGTSNTVSRKYCEGIMTTLAKEVGDRGYQYCDWNVDSNDAGGATTAEEVAANVIAGIQNHKISYVLQHDLKLFSIEAMEEILQWGQENGYRFLALDSTSPMTHHGVNN